jgi:Flp pilus assembly protein TadG
MAGLMLSRVLKSRHGGAIIEFAMLAPLLFTLVLGGFDFGRMFYVRQGLEYATEQAARYYMMNSTASQSTVTSYLQSLMVGGLGSNVSVAYTNTTNCNSQSSVTCTTIAASYSFTFVAGFLGLGTKTLTATSQSVRY